MIVLQIQGRDGEGQRCEFTTPEVTIGRVRGNDLVLPAGNIGKRHARFVERDGKLILVDINAPNGIYVNGAKSPRARVVRATDTIYMGDFLLRGDVLPDWPDDADVTPIVEATELRLLDAIARGDDASRVVYADWLDEHGRPDRAEWLRLVAAHDAAGEPRRGEILARLRELAQTIEVRWRLRVARPRVPRCDEAACPKLWEALIPTDRRHVRACSACTRNVYYCGSAVTAVTHDTFGDRVAVDFYALPEDWRRLP